MHAAASRLKSVPGLIANTVYDEKVNLPHAGFKTEDDVLHSAAEAADAMHESIHGTTR
ncbi:MAG: hypothetical protein HC869_10340 [Rhodospirillales bacterium]|nr:hypothetical protein [Rhodospirillales bacterium]